MSVRSRRLSRGWPLILAIPVLALVAVIAWVLTTPDPESPATPAAPTLSTPQVGGPDIAVPIPSFDAPNIITPPGVSIPTPTLPEVGDGSSDHPPSRSAPVGPERRTEWVHVHRRHWIWELDLPLLLLALVGLVVVRPFARLPRTGQRRFGATVATGLVALATLAFVAGISQESGPGSYQREAPEIERSSEAIVTRIVVDHFHAPVHLAAHWLLLGLGLAALAIPGARVAVASQGTPEAQAAEGAAT